VENTGGEPNTRLERLEQDIAEAKTRLASLETEVLTLKQGYSTMQTTLDAQDIKLDKIVKWVDGANKVLGIATRHWKTALKFGCGVVTAYGISNPQVAHVISFIGNFFGL
jgi:hypothetical protein